MSDFPVFDTNIGVELLLELTSHMRNVLSADVDTITPVFFGFQLADEKFKDYHQLIHSS